MNHRSRSNRETERIARELGRAMRIAEQVLGAEYQAIQHKTADEAEKDERGMFTLAGMETITERLMEAVREFQTRPTTEPKTTPGIALLADWPVGPRVAFDFMPDPELPQGLTGEGEIVGVIEDVFDDGGPESGPHLSVYIMLALQVGDELYHVHPEDGSSRLQRLA